MHLGSFRPREGQPAGVPSTKPGVKIYLNSSSMFRVRITWRVTFSYFYAGFIFQTMLLYCIKFVFLCYRCKVYLIFILISRTFTKHCTYFKTLYSPEGESASELPSTKLQKIVPHFALFYYTLLSISYIFFNFAP